MRGIKLVGVMNESPYDPRTWSGSSAYFFRALDRQGALRAAVSAEPTRLVQRTYQALSFQADMAKWKFRYHLHPGLSRQMTRAARRELDRLDPAEYGAILQVGAWYDLSGYRDKPAVSYHDGNLAARLNSPYGYPPVDRRHLRSALDLERDIYQRMELIFPMSEWLAGSFRRDFGVPAAKLFPVGAGINLPRIREVEGKTYEAPRILFVGKDFRRKGGEDLLAAFRLVRQEIADAELTIIGPVLETIPEGVRCLGFVSKQTEQGVERLLDEYQRATIFVMPSLYEPFGIVFAEAMAHRLPCIGSNICAMPEIIQQGRTGFLCPVRSPETLAAQMIALLKDPARCREFGNAGYERYRRNFTWQAVVQRMCDVMETRI